MKGLLTGIVTRKRDNNKVATTLFLSQVPFNQYESSADRCEGSKTVSEYCGFEVTAKPGDVVEVEYEKNSFDGKAVVANVTVLKKKE